MHHKYLSIYLNDHLAGATSGVELSRRVARAHRSSARAAEVQHLAEDIAEDRQSLLDLMRSLEVAPHRYKVYGGWAVEKIARLKPNGHAHRRSGLSTVVELETLRMGIQGKYLLWRALAVASTESEDLDHSRLHELMDRATSQMAIVDALHGTAARTVLAGGHGRREPLPQAHPRPS
ncbi:hypothetical protein [Streptomyces sp. NPDC001970]